MAGKQHNITVDVNDVLYYVDYDLMNVYVNKNNSSDIKIGKDPIALANPDIYVLDEILTQTRYDRFKEKFLKEMKSKFADVKSVKKTTKGVHHLLQNDIFIVAFEDNNWSIGIELLCNPKYDDKESQPSLVADAGKIMRDVLLDIVEEIHVRTGSWTTCKIDKTFVQNMEATEQSKTIDIASTATNITVAEEPDEP